MDESTQKAVLSLVSVTVGWFLGQGTNLMQKWWTNRKLKAALLLELEDIQHRVKIFELGYARNLQIYAHNGVETSVNTKLNHPIYSKYYTDIFFKLNRAQRNSYEHIHGLIDSVNTLIDKESELISEFTKKKDMELLERYAELIKGQFINVRVLNWHISFHLSNKESPDFAQFRSEIHRDYLKFMDKSNEDIYKIIENAKKLNKEDLAKIYNEKDFVL